LERRAAAALAAGLLASVIAGCGGEEPTGSLRRVRVLAQTHLSQGPLLIALEEGYFRDEGLEIEFYAAGSSREGIPALVNGDLEVLTGSLRPAFLSAIAQGARIRVVADKGHFGPECTYLAFLATPDLLTDGRLQPPPGGRPWRVSYGHGTVPQLLFDRAIAAEGIPFDRLEPYQLSGQTELESMLQGRLDVVSATSAPMQALLDAGEAAIWHTAEELWPNGQYSVVFFSEPLLDRDPETGIRFMTAYLRGVRQYNEGKTERNLDILEKATGNERADLAKACWIGIREDGKVHLETVMELQEWSLSKGYTPRALSSAEIWDPRFVEAAAARLAR
jgi:NitT/TauT family transport system substrate-binding protein